MIKFFLTALLLIVAAFCRCFGQCYCGCDIANYTTSSLLGSISNPGNAVDTSLSTYALFQTLVSGLGFGGSTEVVNLTTPANTGDTVTILIAVPETIISGGFLSGTFIEAYSGTGASGTETGYSGLGSLINFPVINGNAIGYLKFPLSGATSSIGIDVVSLTFGVNIQAYIYNVGIIPGPPSVTGAACYNQSALLTATTPGTNTTIYWYSNAAGTTNIQTSATYASGGSNTYTTPALTTSTTYYVSETSPASCGVQSVPLLAYTVPVDSLVKVSASSKYSTLCSGTTDSLYATPSGGSGTYSAYQWTASPTSGAGITSTTAQKTAAAPSVTSNTNYTYTVTVTDSKGCTATASTSSVLVYANPTVHATANNSDSAVLCNAPTSASLQSSASGGSGTYTSYAWVESPTTGSSITSPSSQNTAVTLSANGTWHYTVTVTDSRGCVGTDVTEITRKSTTGINAVTATAKYAALCSSGATDSLHATPSGGSTYTYSWTTSPYNSNEGLSAADSVKQNNKITPTASTLTTFTYLVQVTDNNKCTATNTVTVTVDPNLAVAPAASPTTVCAGQTVNLTANASGGNGTYTYLWSGSGAISTTTSQNPTAVPTASGVYTLTVTDGNSCTATASTTSVTVNSKPSISATASPTAVCAGTQIALTSSATGGNGTYTYLWSGSGTISTTTSQNPTAVPTASGAYTVTVTDGNNCTATATTASVTVNSNPTIRAAASTSLVCTGSPVTLTSSASGGSGTYNYLWSGSGTITTTTSQAPTAVPTATGAYTVTITDANGCTASATTGVVTVDNATPSISFTCGTNSAGINYLQFNETNGVKWLWTTTSGGRFYTTSSLSADNDSSTSTLQAPFIDYNGTYSVQITDASGCTGSGSILVTSKTCVVTLADNSLGFTAQKQGNSALLSWSTQPGAGTSVFNIQRSSDGINWVAIGTVNADGNNSTPTQYSFTDQLPANGYNYYRLAEVDDNGAVSYSQVKMLQFTGSLAIKIYPNPAQNFVVLEFNSDNDETATIVIQNMLGSTVLHEAVQVVKGVNHLTLNRVQQLAQGTYILAMYTTENTYRSKFVKAGN